MNVSHTWINKDNHLVSRISAFPWSRLIGVIVPLFIGSVMITSITTAFYGDIRGIWNNLAVLLIVALALYGTISKGRFSLGITTITPISESTDELQPPANDHIILHQKSQRTSGGQVGEPKGLSLSFLEMISHELRSPLASIMGYGALLADKEYCQSEEFLEKCRGVILTQGRQIARLSENMVTAARIEIDKLDLNLSTFDLASLLKALIQETSMREKREIVFTNEVDNITVQADVLLLREVFINLLDYTIKHAAIAEPLHLILRGAQTPQQVEIHVQICKIDPNQAHKKIADPPEEGKPIHLMPTNHLGVQIAENIIRRHQGELTLHPVSDKATILSVVLPKKNVS